MATIFTGSTQITSTALRRQDTTASRSCRGASKCRTPAISFPPRSFVGRGLLCVVPKASVPATPSDIQEKVKESIRNAEETCAGDPESGECAAAWDEVEELSAAASHKRDQLKPSDPLEDFCKDHPEAGYCRTYDD